MRYFIRILVASLLSSFFCISSSAFSDENEINIISSDESESSSASSDSNEIERDSISNDDLPTVGERSLRPFKSQPIKIEKGEPRLKYFPKVGWLSLPSFEERLDGPMLGKRKRGMFMPRTDRYNKEYITEFFTQVIAKQSIGILQEKSTLKKTNISILYSANRGLNARSPLLQTPDQGEENSAHVRLQFINQYDANIFYEISYRDGMIAMMPFVIENVEYRKQTYSIAWYLPELDNLCDTRVLLNKDDNPTAGIASLKENEDYIVDMLAKLLFQKFKQANKVTKVQLSSMINSARMDLMHMDPQDDSYGERIMLDGKVTKSLLISRWDIANVGEEEFYLAYTFETKPTTVAEILRIIKKTLPK